MLQSDRLTTALEAARADAAQGLWSFARDHLASLEESLGGRADAQVLYGEALLRTGDPAQAIRWLSKALPVVARDDDRARLRRSHLLAGAADFQLGALDEAIAHFDRAVELALADGDDLVGAQATNNLGTIAHIRGDRTSALTRYRAAVPAYQRLGHVRGLAETLHNMAITHREQGDLVQAEEMELEAARHAQSVGETRLAALAHLERAVIRLRLGDAAFAAAIAEQAEREFASLALTAHQADALRVRGLARLALGDAKAAIRDLDEAVRLIAESPSRFIEAECHRDRARVFAAGGDTDRARADALRAEQLFAQLGAASELVETRELLDALP